MDEKIVLSLCVKFIQLLTEIQLQDNIFEWVIRKNKIFHRKEFFR